ncbi:aspartic peptidase domain-containing protein [Mycena crocata]|nr:aspartic peptidase domain-containing protein [Mycena crocata]
MDADNNIVNNYNDRYTVNLTVAGTSVNVLLDTGSTDMYVEPVGGLSGLFNDTGAVATLKYGDGTNFVNGTVGFAEVKLAGFAISSQAFVNVINSVGEEGDTARGIFGLIGLGFHGSGDPIPSALTQKGYNGTEVGKDPLSRIYEQNPDKGRFFALSLSRVGDINESADASLLIGEYDDKYAAVQDAPTLPQYPPGSGAWAVLTEGVSVGGISIPLPSYSNDTPTGQNIVLLDSGTSNFAMRPEASRPYSFHLIRDAIYSTVPGAVLAKDSSIPNTKASDDEDVWVIPCGTAVNLTTKFAGQEFPIHPLDLTDTAFLVGPDGKNYTVCTGSITNGASALGYGRDVIYGDSFLRNVYSVFSFGNDTTVPHVQLLSQTDATDAAVDFAHFRAELLQHAPPELSPRDIVNLFDGPADPSLSPTDADSTLDSTTPTEAGKASVNLADNGSFSSTYSAVSKYGPIVIGLLGANLLILLLLVALGIMSLIRGGRRSGSTRVVNPKYEPVKLREDASRGSFEHRYSD